MTRVDEAGFTAFARELSTRTGVALDAYKPRCLARRIAVRMRACAVHTYDAYLDVLDGQPAELERLHAALTINVTRFFRNPEVWVALARVLPSLFVQPREVRAWSAGCASGEEAHTLAILLAQAAEELGRPEWLERVRVDATDIDRDSLLRTRAGRYRAAALVEAPAGLVRRWFREDGDAMLVDPALRARIDVRAHDLTGDPAPSARYDLIACRNVVIYFDRTMQERLFTALHDALHPGGYLVLGKVETLVGAARERLELVDIRERIYRRPA
ncbi:MAG TPA: protein-glutamate O-methyltransferase CheR [Gemmatimonadales bacterium]|nr:protein-glutamate O-methyltransferase CheR [Gemmatimonadales bacterium]